jgi:hypothetical protein
MMTASAQAMSSGSATGWSATEAAWAAHPSTLWTTSSGAVSRTRRSLTSAPFFSAVSASREAIAWAVP